MENIKKKNALLTGGSRGLGPYIARALAREGVNVALVARSEDALESNAEGLSRFNIRALAYPGDITHHDFRIKLVQDVKNDFGSIDLLINNAGIELVYSYTSLTPDYIEKIVQTNLIAPLMLTRLVLPDMLERGSGHIVTMSSLGGKKGSPYSATYAATKAGLIQFTAGIREEMRGSGVSASAICPGFVSEAGMFAAYHKSAPKIVGETTPAKVAQAVMRAIREDLGEIIVNPGPIRPMMVLDAIDPGIGSWLLRTFGVYEFYRKQAIENERERGGSYG